MTDFEIQITSLTIELDYVEENDYPEAMKILKYNEEK
jgi:hypothetical protein